uniref:Uncharacterized protein n=1 Tax=Anguilla anguilla TaxID=7936 RepID=A0A0E9TIC4_ANGAN
MIDAALCTHALDLSSALS